MLGNDVIDLTCNEADDSDINDADNEDNLEVDDKETDKIFYNLPEHPLIDKRIVDRSFTNLGYIGFGDGI